MNHSLFLGLSLFLVLLLKNCLCNEESIEIRYPKEALGTSTLGMGIDPMTDEMKSRILKTVYENGPPNLKQENRHNPQNSWEHIENKFQERIMAEIQHWYSQNKSSHNTEIHAKFGFGKYVHGSFAADWGKMHKLISDVNKKTAKITANELLTTIRIGLDTLDITDSFREDVLRIAYVLDKDTEAAHDLGKWLGNRLFNEYGDSVVIEIGLGFRAEMVVSVDILRYINYSDESFKANAGINFNVLCFKASVSGSVSTEESKYSSYNSSITNKFISIIGPPFIGNGPNVINEEYLKSVENNPGVTKIVGVPIIDTLIVPWRFPELSVTQLENVRKLLMYLNHKHIAQNTLMGCMDPSATGFDFGANYHVEDVCHHQNHFQFGGIYQTSSCGQYNILNPVAPNGIGCPEGFQMFPFLQEYTLKHSWQTHECHTNLIWTVCRNPWHTESCTINSYVCLVPQLPGNETQLPTVGMSFGGAYKPNGDPNPLTGIYGCPDGFDKYKIPLAWDYRDYFVICLIPGDSAPGMKSGVEIGGIWPLGLNNPETHQSTCPPNRYFREEIEISGKKDIFWCRNKGSSWEFPPYKYYGYGMKPPPFSDCVPIPEYKNDTCLVIDLLSHNSIEQQKQQFLDHLKKNHTQPLDPASPEQTDQPILNAKDARNHKWTDSNSVLFFLCIVSGIGLLGILFGFGFVFFKMYRHRRPYTSLTSPSS